MRSRLLGSTGLEVSSVALGTAALGQAYGLDSGPQSNPPNKEQALRVINEALERGITLFDTAPTYGRAESLLGLALSNREDAVVATKIDLFDCAREAEEGTQLSLRKLVRGRLHKSLSRLRRDYIDILQVHNATPMILTTEGLDILQEEQEKGLVRYLGASVYGEASALAVVKDERLAVLQVALNILDQRMTESVIPLASERGKGVLLRSALLKGALTDRGCSLPESLAPLKVAIDEVRRTLNVEWQSLAISAIRFCLSVDAASVLIGAKDIHELHEALEAESLGAYSDLSDFRSLGLGDQAVLDPSLWEIA